MRPGEDDLLDLQTHVVSALKMADDFSMLEVGICLDQARHHLAVLMESAGLGGRIVAVDVPLDDSNFVIR